MRTLEKTFSKYCKFSFYSVITFLLGIFTVIPLYIYCVFNRKNDKYKLIVEEVEKEITETKLHNTILERTINELELKYKYFNKSISKSNIVKEANKITKIKVKQFKHNEINKRVKQENIKKNNLSLAFSKMVNNKILFVLSLIVSLPMYLLLLILSGTVTKYILDRLLMMIFVVFGVTFLVFTILHLSPLDPALNILGQTATTEQIEQFNKVYGLDKSYFEQLINVFRNLLTFDMGNTFKGNEVVVDVIANKFPVTMQVAFWAVLVSVVIAIPAGIISAVRQYSSFDYIFMLIALIGLSIPNFWLGLIMILNFSIRLDWLPATFQPENLLSMIMPAIVLGTSLSASVARMTRSSMLEVKNSDYVLTARAKGLTERTVVLRHILRNALIPIITVIGMQFGGMLGGSSVTEKVFNILGLGSWIVDKQFIPDIPAVLASVVYISIVVSLVNLFIDILYTVIDPRIKSKLKNS